jgi:hypothetical protein
MYLNPALMEPALEIGVTQALAFETWVLALRRSMDSQQTKYQWS